MNKPASFKTDNMAFSAEGCLALPYQLDFAAGTTLYPDLSQARQDAVIDFIQSVYVDNADNTAPLDLTFDGGNRPQRIRVPAYAQGIFFVSMQMGSGARFKATTIQGVKVDLIFFNTAFPYGTWGPADGVLVTPALTNFNLDIEPALLGDNVLVAAVPGESVKLYRGIFSVGAASVVKFLDGAGGAPLFSMYLFAGGSVTFQASGVPWITTSVGNALVLNMGTAVNLYGGYGVVQS